MPVRGALSGGMDTGTCPFASGNNPSLQAATTQQLEKVALVPFLTCPLFLFFFYFFLFFLLPFFLFLKKLYTI